MRGTWRRRSCRVSTGCVACIGDNTEDHPEITGATAQWGWAAAFETTYLGLRLIASPKRSSPCRAPRSGRPTYCAFGVQTAVSIIKLVAVTTTQSAPSKTMGRMPVRRSPARSVVRPMVVRAMGMREAASVRSTSCASSFSQLCLFVPTSNDVSASGAERSSDRVIAHGIAPVLVWVGDPLVQAVIAQQHRLLPVLRSRGPVELKDQSPSDRLGLLHGLVTGWVTQPEWLVWS